MEEIWKDIKGYDGLYQISNFGMVKSVRYNTNKILSVIHNTITGYNSVGLCYKNRRETMYIHRAIALAFIENPTNKPHINHKNGVRDDNDINNLEWVTSSENHKHKYDVLGYKQHRRKHTEEEVLKIRGMYRNSKISQIKLVEIFNSNKATINKILKNKAYICK